MTDYKTWDKKAADLCKQAEEEETKEKAENDKDCGLQDGPKGPPTEKDAAMRREMCDHGEGRKKFIVDQNAKEVVITHTGPQDEVIVIDGEEYAGKAVRLRGSTDVSYDFSPNTTVLKIFVESCKGVKVRIASQVTTSFMEVVRCSDVNFQIESTIQMTQADECTDGPVRVNFLEPESVGSFYHQNCPALVVTTPGKEALNLGRASPTQLCSIPKPSGQFFTEAVRRGEKEFPTQLGTKILGGACEPDAETPPLNETRKQDAERKREEGNNAFMASDFMQAAVFYTEALELCNDLYLAFANRAQCWLRLGEPAKALADATKCTVLAGDYAKGWFRKGMSLHALGMYGEAIVALCEAEKLDSKNPQIADAIKMAQMMCRKHGSGCD